MSDVGVRCVTEILMKKPRINKAKFHTCMRSSDMPSHKRNTKVFETKANSNTITLLQPTKLD